MKMAKASEKDIDAAGDAMSVLQDIGSGYYPKREGDECDDFHFDPEDPAHLSAFYRLMTRTLDASPGWPGRVIGGMCYLILYDANKIVDPEADTLELHPRYAAMEEALRGLIARYEHDGIPNDSLPAVEAARAALGVGATRCTYPDCKCERPDDGGCGDPRAYTDAIGQAGEDYHKQFTHAHPLPALWRWQELWERMCVASGVALGEDQRGEPCAMCSGHGLVGGLTVNGYESETCPDCNGTGNAGVETPREGQP